MCARWLPAVDALWTIGHNQGSKVTDRRVFDPFLQAIANQK
ncbi:MAG: hypothetical protein AB7F31_03880 [Parachlamydiales bacterium]